MVDIVGAALGFIAHYGLVAIFILLVLDAAMMLPVFPGEIVLVLAVVTYAKDTASLLFLIAFTTAAALVGSLVLYAIMRGGGRRLVERYPRLFMMPRKRRERMEQAFQKPSGQSLVLFLRLIPLTRIVVNIPAGLARMPVVRFIVLTTLGMLGYHAAFLWFTYEVRQPGSTLATEREQFQQVYASPAMDFVSANWFATTLVALAIGAVLSLRGSRAIARDPEEGSGSLLGWLTMTILLWGGLALAVLTFLDIDGVYDLARLRGVDLDAAARAVGLTTLQLLYGSAAASVAVGGLLTGVASSAKRRRRRYVREKAAYVEGVGRPLEFAPRRTPSSSQAASPGQAQGPPPPGPPAPPRGRRPE